MNQQQQRAPAKTALPLGERLIGGIYLVFGIPLVVVLLYAFSQEPIPRDLAGWVMGAVMFLVALGLNGAGACTLVRQRRFARAFQWLPFMGILGYAIMLGITIYYNGFRIVPLLILIATATILAALITLAVVLYRLGADAE